MKTNIATLAMSFAAVMLAGSCAESSNFTVDPAVYADGAANHPITVEPNYRSLKLSYAGSLDSMSTDDSAQLTAFVSDYLSDANGALTVSAPRGSDSQDAIKGIAERLVALGVPRSHILVGTHDVAGNDGRIELGFVAYAAHTAPCGNWSQDADDTAANLPMPDFGCAVQHNIAAMVANPRDLVTPRPLGQSDAVRRATLTKQYETGQTTAAQKTQDQSGAVSAVGGSGGGQ
ncbi:MAG: CpaD family pilus assembly protein [Rhizomicrobium sp.]